MAKRTSGLRAVLLGAACISALVACADRSLSRLDASTPSGKHDAGAVSDAGLSGPVVCNDGTGAVDCCPEPPMSGADCSYSGPPCWSKCENGTRWQGTCEHATWTLGKGLWPCGSDAGQPSATPDADANVINVNPEPACTDAGAKRIQASDYDQTCALDSDCVATAEGDTCNVCTLECTNAAINKLDNNKYTHDLANIGRAQAGFVGCRCPASFPPCCLGGTCHADHQCSER